MLMRSTSSSQRLDKEPSPLSWLVPRNRLGTSVGLRSCAHRICAHQSDLPQPTMSVSFAAPSRSVPNHPRSHHIMTALSYPHIGVLTRPLDVIDPGDGVLQCNGHLVLWISKVRLDAMWPITTSSAVAHGNTGTAGRCRIRRMRHSATHVHPSTPDIGLEGA